MKTAIKKGWARRTNKTKAINDQRMGRCSGTNSGLLVIDVDDMGPHYESRVFAYDDNPLSLLPAAFAFIETPDKSGVCKSSVELLPMILERANLPNGIRYLGNSLLTPPSRVVLS